jgi:hypothetical protein
MTKGAKGRGDAAPPDPWAEGIKNFRIEYERTKNPVFVWRAIQFIEYASREEEAKTKKPRRNVAQAPDDPSVTLPYWCWQYLYWAARRVNSFSGLHDDDVKVLDHLKGEVAATVKAIIAKVEDLAANFKLSEEQRALNQQAESTLKTLSEMDWRKGEMTAMKAAKALPQIFGFVDGKGYNAFYDHWRAEKKWAVAYAMEVAKKDGMPPAEILAFVSEMTGIYDEPTIRRYVKEAQGKALPRRRSNKPKAPKGKKD